jgi:hypothetical protein
MMHTRFSPLLLYVFAVACGGENEDDMSRMPKLESVNPLFELSGGNLLGKTATITGPNALTQPVQLIRLRTGEPDAPLLLGVQIDVKRGNTNGGPFPFAFATVDWGWQGSRHHAEVDLLRGASFAVNASYLEIGAQIDPVPGANGGLGNPGSLIVSASASEGLVQSTVPLTRTLANLQNLAPGGSSLLIVPSYAKSLVVKRVPETMPIEILVTDGVGGDNLVDTMIPGGATTTELILPNGSDIVQIFNQGAQNITALMAIFELQL